MSKKMSMSDMKEVRRIVTRLLEDSIQCIPIITSRTYQSRISFDSNIEYNGFDDHAIKLVAKHPIKKELSELQRQLFKKQQQLIEILLKFTEKELEDKEGEDINLSEENFDMFGAIDNIISKVKTTLKQRTKESAKGLVEKYNEYISKIEGRTFDAYTKGMSADDFLNIIKEEIKELKQSAEELTKELKINGYSSDN